MTAERPEPTPDAPEANKAGSGETRKAFLLRLPPPLLDAWKRIAANELRSLNAQIELVLREALRRRGGDVPGLDDEGQEPSVGPANPGRSSPAAPDTDEGPGPTK